jgi:predicted fused transcriptional regulator/phosphomethylpyrimidine kinase
MAIIFTFCHHSTSARQGVTSITKKPRAAKRVPEIQTSIQIRRPLKREVKDVELAEGDARLTVRSGLL